MLDGKAAVTRLAPLEANGNLVNVCPPLSERFKNEAPPTTSEFGLSPTTRTIVRFCWMPVTIPAQVEPPSVLLSNVPDVPAA